MSSIHTVNQVEVHEMPMSAITRPLPLMVDESKVQSIAETLMVRESYQNSGIDLNSEIIICTFF